MTAFSQFLSIKISPQEWTAQLPHRQVTTWNLFIPDQMALAHMVTNFWEFQARCVRKVTTGITGLWQPSVHSDVAFWSTAHRNLGTWDGQCGSPT